MNRLQSSALGLATSVLAAVTPNAAAQVYLSGDLGVAYTSDIDIESSSGGELELDPGIRFDGGIGYKFGFGLKIGGEIGYIGNEIDTIRTDGMSLDLDDLENADAWLHHVPFLFTAIYEFDNESRFTPFVGAGLGTLVSIAHIELDDTDDDDDVLEAAAGFAYQFTCGVRFDFNDHIGLGAVYKLLGSPGQEFNDFDDTSVDLELDDFQIHSLSAILNISF